MLKWLSLFFLSAATVGLVRLLCLRPSLPPKSHHGSASQATNVAPPVPNGVKGHVRPSVQGQSIDPGAEHSDVLRFDQFLDTRAGDAITDALNRRQPKYPEGTADPNLLYCVNEMRNFLGDPNAIIQGEYVVTISPKTSSTVVVTGVTAADPRHEGFVECMLTKGVWPWVGATAELPSGSPPMTKELRFAYGYRYYKRHPQ